MFCCDAIKRPVDDRHQKRYMLSYFVFMDARIFYWEQPVIEFSGFFFILCQNLNGVCHFHQKKSKHLSKYDWLRSRHRKRKWWIMGMIPNSKASNHTINQNEMQTCLMHIPIFCCVLSWNFMLSFFFFGYSNLFIPDPPLLPWLGRALFAVILPSSLRLLSHTKAVHSSFKQKSLEHFKHLLTILHPPKPPLTPLP